LEKVILKLPSHIVSEPKHPSAAKQFRSTTNASFAAVGDSCSKRLLSIKRGLSLSASERLDERKRQCQRHEEEEKLRKADMVNMVLLMNAAMDEVKAVVNDYLLSLFKP